MPYVVACSHCGSQFDAVSAAWCGCVTQLRTLVCPKCHRCFCRAPIPYKRKFWNDAPQSLRENINRFSLGQSKALQLSRVDATNVVGPKRSVLVVDDEESIRSFVVCFLEQLGYEVTAASGPEEALLIADAIQFDIVVSDALMPKMDGREMCRRLKQSQGEKLKTIVMTSLYTANRYKVEARHLFRVDEYLSKPLQLGQLKSALERLAVRSTVQNSSEP